MMILRQYGLPAIAVLTLLGAGLLGGPAMADEPTPAPGVPADAPAYDPSVPSPGEGDITWVQLDAMDTTGSFSEDAETSGPQTNAVYEQPGVASCDVLTSNIYIRDSGGVGAKPYTQCNTIMQSIYMETTLYKTVWWGLQQVAGPFTASNTGEGRLQQLDVLRVCEDSRDTTFRMQVRSTGTFPSGNTGTASTEAGANLPCGTNP